MQKQGTHNKNKISPEFAERLGRLTPQDKIRVIVLLRSPATKDAATKRPSQIERQSTTNSVRQASNEALNSIAKIIEDFNGHKLAEQADLLGSIPIEISVAGIKALTESDAVKSILEDQTIRLLNSDSSKKLVLGINNI